MSLVAYTQQHVGCIVLGGDFDFSIFHQFKHATLSMLKDSAIQEIEIGMQHLRMLDSSALGMLMLLREQARRANKTVVLSAPSAYVRKLLEIARFDKLFPIRTARPLEKSLP